MELFPRGPITEATARVHLERAWYVAIGSAAVMMLGGVFSVSLTLLMFVIGGNAPRAEFTSAAMSELEAAGVWPPKT